MANEDFVSTGIVGSPVSHYLGGFSSSSEMKKWLASASKYSSSANAMESVSSRCSSVTNMACFCEANEVCASFDECIADNPPESCLERYNEWLSASSKKANNKPKSAIQMEDKHLWLSKTCDASESNSFAPSASIFGEPVTKVPKVNFSWTSSAHPWSTGVNYWLAQ